MESNKIRLHEATLFYFIVLDCCCNIFKIDLGGKIFDRLGATSISLDRPRAVLVQCSLIFVVIFDKVELGNGASSLVWVGRTELQIVSGGRIDLSRGVVVIIVGGLANLGVATTCGLELLDKVI